MMSTVSSGSGVRAGRLSPYNEEKPMHRDCPSASEAAHGHAPERERAVAGEEARAPDGPALVVEREEVRGLAVVVVALDVPRAAEFFAEDLFAHHPHAGEGVVAPAHGLDGDRGARGYAPGGVRAAAVERIDAGHLLVEVGHELRPVPLRAVVRKRPGKRRIGPASRDPRRVVEVPERAQRLDEATTRWVRSDG